ncbi:hypothetical protein, partial [Escherichia coli]|uniref:hypothetical protein n=1 Tax=Escherichia coli TaxID=562 RepID=UPI001ED9C906
SKLAIGLSLAPQPQRPLHGDLPFRMSLRRISDLTPLSDRSHHSLGRPRPNAFGPGQRGVAPGFGRRLSVRLLYRSTSRTHSW